MDKASFIEQLYRDLKDDIKLDEDIEALFIILKNMLKTNPKGSINNWIYIIQKYDLKKMNKEINFTPLIQNYILELLNVNSLEKIIQIIENLPFSNKQIIKNYFFNVFNPNSGINQYFKQIIIEKEESNTQIIHKIKYILKYSNLLNKLIFEEGKFLRNIFEFYLKKEKIDIKFLLKIANLANEHKNQAILKTLLIDYI